MLSPFTFTAALAIISVLFITSSIANAAECEWHNDLKDLKIKGGREYLDTKSTVILPFTRGSYVKKYSNGELQYGLTQSSNSFNFLNGPKNDKTVLYTIDWIAYPDSSLPSIKKSYIKLAGPGHCQSIIDGQDGEDGDGKIGKVSVQEIKPIFD